MLVVLFWVVVWYGVGLATSEFIHRDDGDIWTADSISDALKWSLLGPVLTGVVCVVLSIEYYQKKKPLERVAQFLNRMDS